MSLPLPPERYRSLARDFLVIACGSSPLAEGDFRPPLGDPVYEAITEGRQQAAADFNARNRQRIALGQTKPEFYSSCGDLAHWLYQMLGVREKWLNREPRYRVGMNVANLINENARWPRIGDAFGSGDVIVVNVKSPPTTHVHVIAEIERDAVWVFGEYGQPGGALRRIAPRSPNPELTDRFFLGQRSADYWLPLLSVLERADAHAALDPPEDPGAWLARVARTP